MIGWQKGTPFAAVAETPWYAEQKFLRQEGLPRRPWFRHLLHAPGYYTGYGVKTLPGVREAIEERQWREVEAQIGFTAQAIAAYAEWIESAAAGAARP